ncbi:MAG TPA: DsbE family thiol:disulfide interchange protein [Rhizomicrobium sp.]|jgi:cytochrome c biogenesis protein CcmG/thiol:disulfide interchange protein DsbE
MNRLIYIVPVLVFIGIAAFFFAGLRERAQVAPDELPSVLVGKPAPITPLPPLDAEAQAFRPADLRSGHVSVVNVFASWCAPCREEAPALRALSQLKGVTLYGMVQKDTPLKARAFLADVGNPYSRIDLDADGRASIEWGVYGLPETFIIDRSGIIRLRYAGAITPDALANTILPAIESAQGPS